MFLLRLFKMVANQTVSSRFEQRSIINFFNAEKFKQCEIYRRMCDVYEEVCFSPRNVYKWTKCELKWQSIEWKHPDSLVKKKIQAL